jgi:hypothetical protein
MLVGTILNVYFIFNPTNYQPDSFNPSSFWDWQFIITSVIIKVFGLVVLYLFFRKSPNNYGKYMSLIFLTYLAYGGLKDILNCSSNLLSAIECGLLFLTMLVFLYLYRKYKFDLFDGL